MMARAYMIKPRLIVADEPVSMVDASLRASILDAMLRLRDEHNISFLYITHDLSTAYQIGDQIYMLYQGTTAERGAAMDVIDAPQHPYVQLLIDSVPVPDPTDKWDVNISLPSEEEMRTAAAIGCRYYPRCPHRMDKCLEAQPPLFKMDKPKHEAACYLYEENDIAPIEPPVLVNQPIAEAAVAVVAKRKRERMVAAVLVVLAFIVGALLAATREPETIVETVIEEVVVVVTATAETAEDAPQAEAPAPTAVAIQAPAVPQASAPIELPDFILTADGASDKGSLTLNETTLAELADDNDKHRYTFAAVDGQSVSIKIRTGGGGLSGASLNSPYGTIYNPDGEPVAALGDTAVRPRRSYNADLVLQAGNYTIIVGPAEVERYGMVGVDEYQLTVEGEAPPEPVLLRSTPMPQPELVLSPDGAADSGSLTLNQTTLGELTADDEKHRYTFAALEGQEVNIKIRTGGGGLSGASLNSPYGTIYSPDGAFLAALGDTAVRPRRSYNAQLQLGAGVYTIIVGPAEVDRYGIVGVDEYQLTVEGEEVALPEPNSTPFAAAGPHPVP